MEKIWQYAGTYRVVSENQMDEENIWYLMDEVGSSIKHSDDPNLAVHPFIYNPNNCFDAHTITYSVSLYNYLYLNRSAGPLKTQRKMKLCIEMYSVVSLRRSSDPLDLECGLKLHVSTSKNRSRSMIRSSPKLTPWQCTQPFRISTNLWVQWIQEQMDSNFLLSSIVTTSKFKII